MKRLNQHRLNYGFEIASVNNPQIYRSLKKFVCNVIVKCLLPFLWYLFDSLLTNISSNRNYSYKLMVSIVNNLMSGIVNNERSDSKLL
jgi:hypothetical protein